MKKTARNLHFPHPGEILRTEFLDEMKLTQYRLAVDTGIPHSRITAIVTGRRSITPDTALRLARYFGNSPDFWLGLQKEYDLRRAREELGERIDHEVQPLVHA
ncbi:MAG: HigA family addiction module antidote protein [Opitutales bacterium]|nr:HigA family addiction module antidote protein [Opitutales bacterium]